MGLGSLFGKRKVSQADISRLNSPEQRLLIKARARKTAQLASARLSLWQRFVEYRKQRASAKATRKIVKAEAKKQKLSQKPDGLLVGGALSDIAKAKRDEILARKLQPTVPNASQPKPKN